MLRAIMEVHFVANIKAQPDDGGKKLDAAARIERSAGGAVAKIKVAEHRAKSCGVDANFKICKPALSKDEGANRSAAGLEFRSNEAVQHTDIGSNNGCRAAGWCDGGAEAARKIVGQVTFELHVGMNVEPHASAQAQVVGVCVLELKVIGEYTDLAVVLRKCGRRQPQH